MTVSYIRPSSDSVQDATGNHAANLTDRAVTNATPRVGAPPSHITIDGRHVRVPFAGDIRTGSCPAHQAFRIKVGRRGLGVAVRAAGFSAPESLP